MQSFDRGKTVIAYCASGGRSALVGKTLKEMGYSNVRNLGGFWLEAGGDAARGDLLDVAQVARQRSL